MALTEQQKAANKAANTVKRRAHTARRRALEAELSAALGGADVVAARTAAEAATKATKARLAERNRQVAAIRAQIAELEAQIVTLQSDADLAALRSADRAAWNQWQALENTKTQAVEQRYPDMAGAARWSAAAWEPPQDVLDAMDAARRA